ncbi:hypothetical protein R6Q59_002006 [Mikania micrantha]
MLGHSSEKWKVVMNVGGDRRNVAATGLGGGDGGGGRSFSILSLKSMVVVVDDGGGSSLSMVVWWSDGGGGGFKRWWFKHMLDQVYIVLKNLARNSAKKAVCNAKVEFGDDLSVIIPYKPRWMGSQIWEKLVEYWNTDDCKAKSSINASNRGKLIGGKHNLGSQTYVTLKRKADKLLGRPATVDEIWMQSHGKKGTRPLDKLLTSKGGERSQETGNLDEIDLQTTVKWVDTRAKDSLKSYKECVKKRYGDDASKQPLFDPDSWIQTVRGRKKGRVYGFSDISDPHVVITSTSPTTTNEHVQRLNEEITKLRQEKET